MQPADRAKYQSSYQTDLTFIVVISSVAGFATYLNCNLTKSKLFRYGLQGPVIHLCGDYLIEGFTYKTTKQVLSWMVLTKDFLKRTMLIIQKRYKLLNFCTEKQFQSVFVDEIRNYVYLRSFRSNVWGLTRFYNLFLSRRNHYSTFFFDTV